jgi:7-cyano-7-deazaguanine synthase in queuosine biosynthesis
MNDLRKLKKRIIKSLSDLDIVVDPPPGEMTETEAVILLLEDLGFLDTKGHSIYNPNHSDECAECKFHRRYP